ncbi:MAG: ubiquitin-like small modifier protein 1 [Candidatus Nezhaarchaeales archaeon]
MKVVVEVYGLLRELMGWRNIEIEVSDGSTLEQLIEILVSEKPEAKELILEGSKLRDYVKVLVNGRDCRFLNGLRTKLEDGYVISIFPPAGGG